MKRQKQYLHLLMDREGPVTSREMALETGVSLRTVKTDMAKLNELLKDYDVHIMSKPGAGYRLVPNDGGGLKPLSLLMEQMQYERFDRIPDTGPERVEYIARKLLALDYYITMEELRQILYVSRSTLNQDMRQVRRLLELYGLKVVHASHKGIRLQGTETALRRCMAELFFRDDGKWEKAPGTGHGEERISQIQQILKSRADALRVSYPEAVVRELALQIYIAAQRCRFRKEVEFDSSLQVSRRFMDMAVSISDGLRETMGISMPDIEIHNMACMLQFRSLKEEAGTEDVRFDGVIRKMFQRIEEKFGLHFSGEQQLSHYLKLHLPRMAERCRNRILIENPVLNDTFCNYPLAVDVANVAVQVLERELDIKVNSNEFGYLAVYFNMCIVTYGERQNKTLILVCPGSRAEAVMYFTELQALFGNYVNTLLACGADELKSMKFTGNEVIVSTVPLYFLPGYVRWIHMGCNIVESFSDIMEALTSLPLESFNIDEFMDRSLWVTEAEADTPDTYFEFLFDTLCEMQMMDFGEARILYENVERFGQELGNQVALIRAENPFLTPFVHVTFTKEPFLWERQYVKVIIFMNVSDGSYEFRNGIYSFLGKWYRHKEKIEESIRCPDFGRFMEGIKGRG